MYDETNTYYNELFVVVTFRKKNIACSFLDLDQGLAYIVRQFGRCIKTGRICRTAEGFCQKNCICEIQCKN